jgi:hypothetical protein
VPLLVQALRGTSGELPASATAVPEPASEKNSSDAGKEVSKQGSPAAGSNNGDSAPSGGAANSTTATSGGTAIMIEASDVEVMVRQNEDIFKQMSGVAQRLASNMKTLTQRAAIRSETGESCPSCSNTFACVPHMSCSRPTRDTGAGWQVAVHMSATLR